MDAMMGFKQGAVIISSNPDGATVTYVVLGESQLLGKVILLV